MSDKHVPCLECRRNHCKECKDRDHFEDLGMKCPLCGGQILTYFQHGVKIAIQVYKNMIKELIAHNLELEAKLASKESKPPAIYPPDLDQFDKDQEEIVKKLEVEKFFEIRDEDNLDFKDLNSSIFAEMIKKRPTPKCQLKDPILYLFYRKNLNPCEHCHIRRNECGGPIPKGGWPR